MNNIQVQRILVTEFTTFIKKLLPIDKFIYLKITNDTITSNCYLPERDAVKVQSIPTDEIFEIKDFPDKPLKMSFLNGTHTSDALKHFTGLQVSAEISFKDYGDELVATNLKLVSEDLSIDLPCADPSLGFQDMSTDQIKRVFSTDSSIFTFEVHPHHVDKLNSLFNLEKELETFKISTDENGRITFKGNTYDTLVQDSKNKSQSGEVTVYKKYLNLLDKETYTVTVCEEKVVWRSSDSNTLLTIATCINA
jgi:hypothetical protein